jgi:hypothetical protein
MRSLYIFLFTGAILAPLLAQADFVVSKPSGDPFDNLQNLTLQVQTSDMQTILQNHGTVSLRADTPISFSYQISHKSTWPKYNVSSTTNDSLFFDELKSNKLYLELWEGTPFANDAHLLQNWDISNEPSGQITTSFPEAGHYFVVAYFPDGFYQDPESACPDDYNWQIDCAPSYSLEQMRGYFTYPTSSADAFPYMPDAFSGTEFEISSPVTKPTASNVLFLPGIEGSRLYTRNTMGGETTLWEPALLSNISNLALNPDGTSKHEIYTRDLVDYKYSIKALGDVYGPFEDFMNSLVLDGTISKWRAYPYDWRYDVRDIVTNGTLVGNTSGPLKRIYLIDALQELASTSPTGKVTIIAHSNGGLLAKALAIELEKESKINLLDQIILIGSPQFGTPSSIGALLNGDGQTDATGGFIMYGNDVRKAAATMPSMYGLIPSATYLSHVADSPIQFVTNAATNLFTKYFGSQISSESALENFLADVPNLRSNFSPDDLRTPLTLSDELLEKEFETHSQIDVWNPPSGITLTTISGWGNPTPYQYSYSTTDKKVLNCFRSNLFLNSCAYSYEAQHQVINSESGDDTVVFSDALRNSSTSQSFYFNAKKFSTDKLGTIGHGNLTSAQPIESFLGKLLRNENDSVPYISISAPVADANSFTVISIHSPANIIATDDDGNQTGIFPVPGKADIYYEKRNIPGSYLQTLDDEKYVYLPKNLGYSISLQGYADGEMTVDMGSVDSSGITSTTEEFSNIPINSSTTAKFLVQSDVSTSSSSVFPTQIDIDIFGDGSTTTFTSQGDGLQSLDTDEIFKILEKEFSALSVRRGIKNRFLSELAKIKTNLDPQNKLSEVTYLEKIITAQIEIKLTNAQGVFFLELLDQLKK